MTARAASAPRDGQSRPCPGLLGRADDLARRHTALPVSPAHHALQALDTDAHWANRYYHRYNPIDTIAEAGANVITFTTPRPSTPNQLPLLRARIHEGLHRRGHAAEMRVKATNGAGAVQSAPELFALFSLGHEVLSAGPGGGFPGCRSIWRATTLPGGWCPTSRTRP